MKLNLLNISFLLALICISFPSCHWHNKQSHPLLQEAELLLDTAPDSAYYTLLQADSLIKFTSSQRAEWNLLITQAMDKAYMEHTSDSLIRETVNYYEHTKEIDKQVCAYYTWGRVLQELGDAPRAQECYLEALNRGRNLQDIKLLARIENNLGMLYTYQEAYELGLEHLEKAVQYNEMLSDSVALSYALRDKGRIYGQLQQVDLAIESYLEALLYCNKESRQFVWSELGSLYTEREEYDTAYYYLNAAFPKEKNTISYFSACLSMGKYFVAINHIDSAYYYLNQSVQSPRLNTQAGSYYYLAQLARKNKQWEEYVSLHTLYEKLRTEITQQKHNETVQRVQQLYNYSLVRNEAEKIQFQHAITKKNNLLLLLFILLLVILLLGYILYIRRKRREWQKRLNQLSRESLTDKEELEKNKLRLSELGTLLKDSGGQRQEELSQEKDVLENINRAIEFRGEAKRFQNDEFYKTPIYHHFQQVNDLGKITETDKQKLFQTIDAIYPDFRQAIETYIPEITPLELDLCYFMKAGIKQVDIGRLCLMKRSTIGMRFNRLIGKIDTSEKISNEKFREWISSL